MASADTIDGRRVTLRREYAMEVPMSRDDLRTAYLWLSDVSMREHIFIEGEGTCELLEHRPTSSGYVRRMRWRMQKQIPALLRALGASADFEQTTVATGNRADVTVVARARGIASPLAIRTRTALVDGRAPAAPPVSAPAFGAGPVSLVDITSPAWRAGELPDADPTTAPRGRRLPLAPGWQRSAPQLTQVRWEVAISADGLPLRDVVERVVEGEALRLYAQQCRRILCRADAGRIPGVRP